MKAELWFDSSIATILGQKEDTTGSFSHMMGFDLRFFSMALNFFGLVVKTGDTLCGSKPCLTNENNKK